MEENPAPARPTRALNPSADAVIPGTLQSIRHPKLLIGEGGAERDVLIALLQHMNVSDVSVEEHQGKDNLRRYLRLLKTRPEFVREEVVSIGILRDADDNPDGAFQSVCSALGIEELPVPNAVGSAATGTPSFRVFIIPAANRVGMLESLCMDSVAEDKAVPCVDAFVDCVKAAGIDPKPLPKVRARAWLSTRPNPDAPIGSAARQGYWKFDHTAFDPLKAFIRSL